GIARRPGGRATEEPTKVVYVTRTRVTCDDQRDPGRGCGTFRSDGSADPDVARLRPLGAVFDLVLHPHSLVQALEALAADRAEVDEHVLAAIVLRDEAVALVVAEPLDGSGCHLYHLPGLRHERAAEGPNQNRNPPSFTCPT